MGGSQKNLTCRGWGSRKINIDRGLPKKGGGLGQFVDLRGAWQERGGGVFEGGCYTNAHYDSANMLLEIKESRESSLNLSNNKMVILLFWLSNQHLRCLDLKLPSKWFMFLILELLTLLILNVSFSFWKEKKVNRRINQERNSGTIFIMKYFLYLQIDFAPQAKRI